MKRPWGLSAGHIPLLSALKCSGIASVHFGYANSLSKAENSWLPKKNCQGSADKRDNSMDMETQ